MAMNISSMENIVLMGKIVEKYILPVGSIIYCILNASFFVESSQTL